MSVVLFYLLLTNKFLKH